MDLFSRKELFMTCNLGARLIIIVTVPENLILMVY